MKKTVLFTAILSIAAMISEAQITQLAANNNADFVGIINLNKAVYTSSVSKQLFITDGTVAGTAPLSSTITFEDEIGMVGNKILFKGSSAAAGSELFITDGTTAGTQLVKDINPGTGGSQIDASVALLNGYLYFSAVTPTEGREIWKTDGTPAGTTLLKDIAPGTLNSNEADKYKLFSNGRFLLFSARGSTNDYELWKSNGTPAGTDLLVNINPGTNSSAPTNFYQLGNTVLFHATTATNGKELWKTDGTVGGTMLVKDIAPGAASSTGTLYEFFYAFKGKAYFNAIGTSGEELWSTDGTGANTQQVKDIQPGNSGSFNFLVNAITIGDKFIFPSGNLFGTRYELWQSDGTEAGTTRLKDFTSGGTFPIIMSTYSYYSSGQPLFQGNKVFLYASTADDGLEIWITDGTEAGTKLVKDINPVADAISVPSFQYAQNALYFTATDGITGNELWKTDGTTSGTQLVADINPGAGESDPQLWPIFTNKLLFTASNGTNAYPNLYVLNGSINPLPLQLGSFTIAARGNDGLLRWNTLQEENTGEFMVQRSLDGVHFQNIGSVKATGHSTSPQSYLYADAGVAQYGKDILYYRLQVLDKDGRTELTKVINLQLSGSLWSIRLVNNPVQSGLQVSLTGTTTTTSFKITDISGKSYTTAAYSGNGIIRLPVQDLPAGMYILTAENAKGRQTVKFVKN